MEDQWIVVYKTENAFAAEVLKQGLTEEEIPAVVINKKFNAYNIGMIEVLVNPADKEKAEEYILNNDI